MYVCTCVRVCVHALVYVIACVGMRDQGMYVHVSVWCCRWWECSQDSHAPPCYSQTLVLIRSTWKRFSPFRRRPLTPHPSLPTHLPAYTNSSSVLPYFAALSLSVSVSVSLCVSLSCSLTLPFLFMLSLTLSRFLSYSVSVCVSVCLSFSPSPHLCFLISQRSFCLSLSPSVSLSVSLSAAALTKRCGSSILISIRLSPWFSSVDYILF